MWLKSHIAVWLTLCFPWCITGKKMKISQTLSDCQNTSYNSEIKSALLLQNLLKGQQAGHNPYMMHTLVIHILTQMIEKLICHLQTRKIWLEMWRSGTLLTAVRCCNLRSQEKETRQNQDHSPRFHENRLWTVQGPTGRNFMGLNYEREVRAKRADWFSI